MKEEEEELQSIWVQLLQQPDQFAVVRSGMRIIGDVLRSRAMENNFRFYEGFCRSTVNTIWHNRGGCVVGKVVDQEFRVMGVEALRIVNGSTSSVLQGTNPQATLLMLSGYTKSGYWEEAVKLFRKMKDLNVRFNDGWLVF